MRSINIILFREPKCEPCFEENDLWAKKIDSKVNMTEVDLDTWAQNLTHNCKYSYIYKSISPHNAPPATTLHLRTHIKSIEFLTHFKKFGTNNNQGLKTSSKCQDFLTTALLMRIRFTPSIYLPQANQIDLSF